MSKERQILQLRCQGYSQRKIAEALQVSRNTVAKVFEAVSRNGVPDSILNEIGDLELHQKLFPESQHTPALVTPDFEYLHKELLKAGVTLKLLWEEYVADCRSAQKPPYMYSQFCKLYQDFVDVHRLTMHINHKPGDKLMVDWMGTSMPLFDKTTGTPYKVFLFVATLPFSMYGYAEACLTLKEEDWINTHINMFEYFGGCTRLLIPDNLKTGILSNRKYEDPISNRTYQELADHYHTAILPTRVVAPKDKAAVESTVGTLTTTIVAKLRNRKFFTLQEMNHAIRKTLDEFNQNAFQKREGSRYSVFQEEERPYLLPLPAFPFEFGQWKTATVQLNYHISIDHANYSVPYEYVKKKVEVRYSRHLIEIYYGGSRIASHKRLYGKRGQYSTIVDHMPINHQLYSEWDKTRFLRWSESIGVSTTQVVQKLFSLYRVEEQAYKGFLSLLKLADKYTPERLENACKIALLHIPYPRYKNIRLILEAGEDRKSNNPKSDGGTSDNQYALVRGASYFGGGHHEE